ncbi:MAG TPA: Gmad2 immunoglobulin-like domain-containing protein [Anaerolineaceae bacterium]|nr:Gmad2 immunoglobulin-like domain-containing protein [Anaerolineaceae bacterium]
MRSVPTPAGLLKKQTWTLCLAAALLAACAISPSTPVNSPTPQADTPTVTLPAQQAGQDSTPAASPAVSETSTPQPVDSPTQDLNPTGTPIPEEYIATLLAAHETPTRKPSPTPSVPLSYLYITHPGPLSRVTSPITLLAQVIPGAGGVVRIELIGEDGRVLVREIERYNMPPGTRFGIGPDLAFEIPGVAEAARLQVSVFDPRGRPVAKTSVRLILLSLGDAEINPVDDFQEPFYVTSPRPDDVISGGAVSVQGRMRALNANPIVFELFDEKGQVVGSRQIAPPSTNGSYQPFSAEIPYSVKQKTSIRLVIRQPDDGIPGDIALSSLTLTLKP